MAKKPARTTRKGQTIRAQVDPFTPPNFEVLGWERDEEGVVTGVVLEWTYPTGERVSSGFAFSAWRTMPSAYEAELDEQAAQLTRDAMNGVPPRTWIISGLHRSPSE